MVVAGRARAFHGARVVDGHPRRLVDDLVVDACPERAGGARVVGLEREGLGDLGVDASVAELGGIEVSRVVGAEGVAG